jgi:hypothetical protein
MSSDQPIKAIETVEYDPHSPTGILAAGACSNCGETLAPDTPVLLHAYVAARQARFEFGETPG